MPFFEEKELYRVCHGGRMSPFFKLEPSPSFYELCLDEPKLALSHLESCYNLSSFPNEKCQQHSQVYLRFLQNLGSTSIKPVSLKLAQVFEPEPWLYSTLI